MLNQMAKNFADITVRKSQKHISQEILIYGYELMMSNLFSISTMLLIGVMLNRVLLAVIFFLAFSAIRIYCGGYHASTYGRCFLQTILTYIAVTESSVILAEFNHPTFLIIIASIGTAFLIKNAPFERKEHPLSSKQLIRNRHKLWMVIVIENICIILCALVNQMEIAYILALCELDASFLILIGKYRERREKGHD